METRNPAKAHLNPKLKGGAGACRAVPITGGLHQHGLCLDKGALIGRGLEAVLANAGPIILNSGEFLIHPEFIYSDTKINMCYESVTGEPEIQAMKQLQLEMMSVDQLWELHEHVSQVLSMRIIEEKQQLEQRLEQLNQAHHFGVNADERPRRAEKGRRFYPKVYPKYQNPQEPSETWSGRGKQPRWLVKALQTGKKIDDFRIENDKAPARQPARAEG